MTINAYAEFHSPECHFDECCSATFNETSLYDGLSQAYKSQYDI